MNKNNIKVSIKAVQERQNFTMEQFIVETKLKNITCATACCIAGSTALTNEFKQARGGIKMDHHNQCIIPFIGSNEGSDAMADFWDVREVDAREICISEDFYCVELLSQVTRTMALHALNYLLDNGTTEGYKPLHAPFILRVQKFNRTS